MELVFATGNKHKAQEAQQILLSKVPGLRVLSYSGPEPVEDGVSFLENAMIKAKAAFAETGMPSFADDSGIAVEILGGSPGIFSAIWSGTRDDKTNRDLLLAQLLDIHPEHRAAAFICTVALVTKDSQISFTGVWSGSVAMESLGTNGHGYDPVFIPEGFKLTSAQLDPEVKNTLSHRFLALTQMAEYLAR